MQSAPPATPTSRSRITTLIPGYPTSTMLGTLGSVGFFGMTESHSNQTCFDLYSDPQPPDTCSTSTAPSTPGLTPSASTPSFADTSPPTPAESDLASLFSSIAAPPESSSEVIQRVKKSLVELGFVPEKGGLTVDEMERFLRDSDNNRKLQDTDTRGDLASETATMLSRQEEGGSSYAQAKRLVNELLGAIRRQEVETEAAEGKV